MQAEVLPSPTAPKMATPVYGPRSGMMNQEEGLEICRMATGGWTSPATIPGPESGGLQRELGQLAKRKQIAVAVLEPDLPDCDEKRPAG